MEDFKIKIDEDLIQYLIKKNNVDEFINSLIRERMKAENLNSVSNTDAASSWPKQKSSFDKKKEADGDKQPISHSVSNPLPAEDKPVVMETHKDRSCLYILLGLGFFIFVFAMVMSSINDKTKPSKIDNGGYTANIVPGHNAEADKAKKAKKVAHLKTWSFKTEKDAMTDSKNIWANLTSDNIVDFSAPYDGGSNLTITIRYMKKYGFDAMLQISSGQFDANEYSGTNYITARFDGGSARKYYVNEPSDGSSDYLFIRKKSDFIMRCKKAKSIKIEAPFYQEGTAVFNFKVDKALEWKY